MTTTVNANRFERLKTTIQFDREYAEARITRVAEALVGRLRKVTDQLELVAKGEKDAGEAPVLLASTGVEGLIKDIIDAGDDLARVAEVQRKLAWVEGE